MRERKEGGKKRQRERGGDLIFIEHLINDTYNSRFVLTFSYLNLVTNL